MINCTVFGSQGSNFLDRGSQKCFFFFLGVFLMIKCIIQSRHRYNSISYLRSPSSIWAATNNKINYTKAASSNYTVNNYANRLSKTEHGILQKLHKFLFSIVFLILHLVANQHLTSFSTAFSSSYFNSHTTMVTSCISIHPCVVLSQFSHIRGSQVSYSCSLNSFHLVNSKILFSFHFFFYHYINYLISIFHYSVMGCFLLFLSLLFK